MLDSYYTFFDSKANTKKIFSPYRVLDMQEKPDHPKSHYAVPPFYIYKQSDLKKIKECVEQGCDTDALGSLVKSLLAKTVFHAWPMTGQRFDIGTLETYNQFKTFSF